MHRTAFLTILGVVLLMPFAVSAQGGLVPCDGVTVPCQACHAVQLGQNIITFLVEIAAFIAVLIFSYAGFIYVTAGGNPGRIQKAHGLFTNVAIGFLIVLAGWLVVDTVMKYAFQGLDGRQGSDLYEQFTDTFGPWNQINCVVQPEFTEPTSAPGGSATGNGSTPPSDASCTNCTQISAGIQVKQNACSGTQPCQVAPSLASSIDGLASSLDSTGVPTSQWRITEAWPPTVTHQNACHNAGTCVDVNFVGVAATPSRIGAVIQAANANGLRAVYEVRTAAERQSLINAGVPAANIQAVSRITAPHFSVYSQ